MKYRKQNIKFIYMRFESEFDKEIDAVKFMLLNSVPDCCLFYNV